MSENSLGNFQPLLKWLPPIANLLLIVAMGWTGARLIWQLWPVEAAALPAQVAPVGEIGERAKVDVERIAAADLFGPPPADNARANEVIDAPETRLNLTLTGIISSDTNTRSRALIKQASGTQLPYAVGSPVADGVKLHDIQSTRVILDRGGRFETLTLERLKEAGQGGVARASTSRSRRSGSSGNSGGGNVSATLSNVRAEILAQPSKITEYLRIQPERRDGNLQGYRVYPGEDRTLFQKLGLRSGELVTQVNGTALNDPQQAMQSLSSLAEAPSVSVTLKRGGRERTMSVDFE